ncbi:MAG: sulfatase [Planctomycetota bacterium]|nr:sulfatase [Planctomycetota bacterium]
MRTLVGLTACWLMGTVAAAQQAMPNVVLFVVDDMGVMDTSVPFLTDSQGRPIRYPLNTFYRTPHMEKLAAQGVRFNAFYAMSVCSPTRISIMTGQNAARHLTTNWIRPDRDNRGTLGPHRWNWMGLSDSAVTLPALLQAAGYRTIHVGKGHFGPRIAPGSDPKNLGFDVNIGGSAIGAPGSYFGMQNYGAGTKRASHAVPHLEKYHGTETFLTEALTQEAQSQISDAVAKKQPFFLYMSHYAVHAPFHSDRRFAANYRDSGKSRAAQAFATMIEGMDRSLGDLRSHLAREGVAQDTLILFVGDNGSDAPLGPPHGVACAAPLRGKKGAHYEGGMRVPFIAAWAELEDENPHQQRLPIARGVIQAQQAAVYDLFPTILSVANVTEPADHVSDGAELRRLLSGQRDAGRPEFFLMHYPHGPHRSNYFTCLRHGDWKVIYHYVPSTASHGSHYQLYHLERDPFESQNLAGAEPGQLRKMMRELIQRLEAYGAAYPIRGKGDRRPRLPKLPPELRKQVSGVAGRERAITC